jgi:hypothetical protein
MKKQNLKEVHGVFLNGKFYAYPLAKGVGAKLISKNKEVIKHAKQGKIIHGSFKDGEFKPFVKRFKFEYVDPQTKEKAILERNYKGEIFHKGKHELGMLPSGMMIKKMDSEAILKGWCSYDLGEKR